MPLIAGSDTKRSRAWDLWICFFRCSSSLPASWSLLTHIRKPSMDNSISSVLSRATISTTTTSYNSKFEKAVQVVGEDLKVSPTATIQSSHNISFPLYVEAVTAELGFDSDAEAIYAVWIDGSREIIENPRDFQISIFRTAVHCGRDPVLLEIHPRMAGRL